MSTKCKRQNYVKHNWTHNYISKITLKNPWIKDNEHLKSLKNSHKYSLFTNLLILTKSLITKVLILFFLKNGNKKSIVKKSS